MKKILEILIISAVLLTTAIVFTTCKQFIDNPEEFLGYWSSEVVPTDFSIDKPTQKIGDVECIPSYWNGTYSDVTLTIKLHNPRKFSLITPTSASSTADVQKIINFPGLLTQPTHGSSNGYTLVQTPDKQALKLTYKPGFLKKYEWGTGNISPEITLTSTDGRKFNKKFSLNLKADTAPSLEYKGVGKSSDNKYVLIFQAKNVNDPLPPPLDHLHGDIKKQHITTEGGSSSDYTVTGINFTAKTINWTDSSKFLTGAIQLAAGDCEGTPPTLPTGDWLIYFKTDVAVSSSSALKTYRVRLSDRAGLVSNEVQGSTCMRKVGEIQVKENLPNQGESGSDADPYLINCVGDGVDLEVWCLTPTENVNILYWTYKQNPEQLIASASGEGTASPTNHLQGIKLPAPSAIGSTIKYKVMFKADKPGFTPNAKIVYYKLKRAEVIGSSLSSPTAKWQALKDAVESASDGDVFYIEGEYTMPDGSDTMVPAANCTIRGTNNAVLNADNKGKMISVISPGLQNMTLENLTIKNGKDDEFALSASWGFEFYLKNVTVEGTKKIIESNSGDVIFENVKAHDTDSIIELGGLGHTHGDILYSYLTLQGDTDIKGTVKLIFPHTGVNYSGAIKICDKKSYTLKLDFKNDSNNYYSFAENQQVVFLDNSVTGFSLAQAVRNITVKPNGSDQYYINNSGYLKKR